MRKPHLTPEQLAQAQRDRERGEMIVKGSAELALESQLVTAEMRELRSRKNREISRQLLADIDSILPEDALQALSDRRERAEANRRAALLDEARSRAPSVEQLQRENTHRAWVNLVSRICDPASKSYRHWGGAGVTLHPAWSQSFEQFITDLGPQPSPRYALRRTDKANMHFEPGNVQWEEVHVPRHGKGGRPKRGTQTLIEYEGTQVTLPELAELTGVRYQTIMARWHSGKRTVAQLTLPVRANATGQSYNVTLSNTQTGDNQLISLKDLCRAKGVSYSTAVSRLRSGKTLYEALAPRREKQTEEERRAKQREYYRNQKVLSQLVTDEEM